MSMKPTLKWQSICWSLLIVLSCVRASGQVTPKAVNGCVKGTDYEKKYTIRDARIEDPWSFLRFRGSGGDDADKAVAALKGTLYKKADLDAALKVVENRRLLPADLQSSSIEVANCSGNQLDVIFSVFSAQISPVFSTTFEFRQLEKSNPEVAAGISRKRLFRVTPLAGYNQTDKLFGGGNIIAQWGEDKQPFNSISLKGYGSSSSHFVSATLAGHYESSTKRLASADWLLDYQHSSAPTDRAKLKQGLLALQISGETHPFGGVILRFGASAEGGNQQSNFAASDLAPDTLASTDYSSLKFYGGITAHPRYQALAVSYGLEFGSTGKGFHGDWRKHIGDAAYEFWLPFGDHRLFEVEQRLTVGAIQTLHSVPVGALFFGGNREEQFIAGETWTIRSNPVIRSIPANRFYRTSAGAGGTRFVSYNSTIGVTVWRSPLVSKELNDDPQFRKKLNGGLVSATSVLEVAYRSDDKNFHDALNLLPSIDKNLEALRVAVTNAGTPPSEECTDAIGTSQGLVKNARNNKPVRAYGSVKELLPGGEGALVDAASICSTAATAQPVITAANDLTTAANNLKTSFDKIDTTAAQAKAIADMSYVHRTLNIILKELNIASVSPIFVFDMAHVGPATTGPYSGTRYGVGGGLRFSLLNTVNVTGGYSWNLNRRIGEESGAVFFSLSTRNLFK